MALGQEGCIVYPMKELGLCGAVTSPLARLRTTTEVYPDSPKANADICNRAQVASITGGLDYMLAHLP
jgi:hypothetical protein